MVDIDKSVSVYPDLIFRHRVTISEYPPVNQLTASQGSSHRGLCWVFTALPFWSGVSSLFACPLSWGTMFLSHPVTHCHRASSSIDRKQNVDSLVLAQLFAGLFVS